MEQTHPVRGIINKVFRRKSYISAWILNFILKVTNNNMPGKEDKKKKLTTEEDIKRIKEHKNPEDLGDGQIERMEKAVESRSQKQ